MHCCILPTLCPTQVMNVAGTSKGILGQVFFFTRFCLKNNFSPNQTSKTQRHQKHDIVLAQKKNAKSAMCNFLSLHISLLIFLGVQCQPQPLTSCWTTAWDVSTWPPSTSSLQPAADTILWICRCGLEALLECPSLAFWLICCHFLHLTLFSFSVIQSAYKLGSSDWALNYRFGGLLSFPVTDVTGGIFYYCPVYTWNSVEI